MRVLRRIHSYLTDLTPTVQQLCTTTDMHVHASAMFLLLSSATSPTSPVRTSVRSWRRRSRRSSRGVSAAVQFSSVRCPDRCLLSWAAAKSEKKETTTHRSRSCPRDDSFQRSMRRQLMMIDGASGGAGCEPTYAVHALGQNSTMFVLS